MLIEKINTDIAKTFAREIGTTDLIDSSLNAPIESNKSKNATLLKWNFDNTRSEKKRTYIDYNIDGDSDYNKQIDFQENVRKSVKCLDHLRIITEKSFYRWMLEKQNKEKINSEMTSGNHVSNVSARGRIEKSVNLIKFESNSSMNVTMDINYRNKHILNLETDRLGIPISMIDKARRQQQKRRLQENILRKVRLTHMGWRQPPSDEDNSDDESIQNAKKIALLRTPYFLVPIIKISKRKERMRNQYLQKDRLLRINILLLENRRFGFKSNQSIQQNLTLGTNILKIQDNKFRTKETKTKVVLNHNRLRFRRTISLNYKQLKRLYDYQVVLLRFKI